MKYILLYPESHGHLGLFDDLKDKQNFILIEVGYRELNSKFLKKIRRVHTSWTINKRVPLPFRTAWYSKPEIDFDPGEEYCIIVFDGALKGLKTGTLNKWLELSNVRGVLVFINSMDASSVAILEIRKKFPKVHWNEIYTFDPGDVRKYGYHYLGNCYYSMHDMEKARIDYPDEKFSDIYFTGGLKGGREALMQSLFESFDANGIRTNFNFAVSGERRLKTNPHADKINYYSGGWFPYERVLAGLDRSKVILEVLQNGQTGPSLRYFEAVCYNKKLLTNNPEIKSFPYYDDRYMKIFNRAEDIDPEWIREETEVEYHYAGDFSPVFLPEHIMNSDSLEKEEHGKI